MWSKKHNLEKCNSCKRNNIPHKAIGLCKTCYEKSKNYFWQKSYKFTHRKQINSYQRKWNKANPSSVKTSRKKWISKNRNKNRQYLATWRKKHRAKFCLICGEDRICEWAHIIPISKKGPTTPWNLIPLCPTHHRCFDFNLLNEEEIKNILPFIQDANYQFKNSQHSGVLACY